MSAKDRAPAGTAAGDAPEPGLPRIDPDRTALLMLHWQNDLADERGRAAGSLPGRLAASGTVARTRAVLEASRRRGVHVAYVNASHRPGYPELPPAPAPLGAAMLEAQAFLRGTWGVEVIEPLRPAAGDLEIVNSSPNAFAGTDLDLLLRNRGVTALVLTGLVTNWVVETTARDAFARGYFVYTLSDCCESWEPDAHEWSAGRVLPLLGAVCDAQAYLRALGA